MRSKLITLALASAALLAAAPAAAETYVIGGLGIAAGHPEERNVERPEKNFTMNFRDDGEGAAGTVGLGHDLGPVRVEAAITGAWFMPGDAGCPTCKNGNPGFNGRPNDSEGRDGGYRLLQLQPRLLVDLALSRKVTLSFGGGPTFSHLGGGSNYASAKRQGWRLNPDNGISVGVAGLVRLEHQVGERTHIGAQASYDILGTHETDAEAESGKDVGTPLRERMRLPMLMLTLRQRIGG